MPSYYYQCNTNIILKVIMYRINIRKNNDKDPNQLNGI